MNYFEANREYGQDKRRNIW